jgi:hypothetical protein
VDIFCLALNQLLLFGHQLSAFQGADLEFEVWRAINQKLVGENIGIPLGLLIKAHLLGEYKIVLPVTIPFLSSSKSLLLNEEVLWVLNILLDLARRYTGKPLGELWVRRTHIENEVLEQLHLLDDFFALVCHSFNLIKKEGVGCAALLLPDLLRVICLVVELEGKDLNLKGQLIISDVFETLIFPALHPFVELFDELAIPELNIGLIKI